MLQFRELRLEDRQWVNECLKASDFKGCEYSFANNYVWKDYYGVKYANINGFYCSRSEKDDKYIYTYPAGKGDIKPIIDLLIEDSKENGKEFWLRGMSIEVAEELKKVFPDMFEYITDRDDSDYIYLTEKLITLAGKKLHGKRNHIARFMDNNNWQYENINKENIEECWEMSRDWSKAHSERGNYSNDIADNYAVKETFDNFFELELEGGLIRLDNKVIAFCIGEPLSSDTYVVHIEKAYADIQGAYAMINKQFVIEKCQNYKYVNREEDIGVEGLRRAKLSYYPEIIYDKYSAKLK